MRGGVVEKELLPQEALGVIAFYVPEVEGGLRSIESSVLISEKSKPAPERGGAT